MLASITRKMSMSYRIILLVYIPVPDHKQQIEKKAELLGDPD